MSTLIYDRLGRIYDELWASVSLRYLPIIKMLLRERQVLQGRLLDLACGTGTLVQYLARDGHYAYGLDISRQMISAAREKSRNFKNVFLTIQDMSAIGFNEKFNAVTCLFDSLNYITSESKLQRMFDDVARVLDSEGFFLFDFNSESQYQTMRDSRFTLGTNNNFILRHSFAPQKKVATSLFQFDDGIIEVHKQRAYTLSQIKTILKNSGLRLLDSFSSADDRRFSVQDKRVICIAELN